MKTLTYREVQEQHGGKLPAGCTLRPEDPEAVPVSKPAKLKTTRSERFATLNDFVDATLAKLSGAEAKVWLTLFRDTKANGLARTGQTDLARRTGLHVRSVKRVISRLVELGLLTVTQRGKLNQGPSVYRVLSTVA